MKKQVLIFSLLVMFFATAFTANSQSVPSDNSTDKQVEKWYNKKEWLNGLQLAPYSGMNIKEFAKQYRLNKTYWDEAFAFLKNHDLNTIAKGKYPIDGDNVFASVTTDSTKDFDKTKWESHRKYIDLQYIIDGEEKMGVSPVSQATVTNEYNEKKDVANYTSDGKYYVATPGTFFIFFPSETHRPSITTSGNKVDKKIVIKVRAAE